jgi:hypothetical protein
MAMGDELSLLERNAEYYSYSYLSIGSLISSVAESYQRAIQRLIAMPQICLRGGRFVAMDWYLIGLVSAALTVVGFVSYLILAD